MQADTLQTTGKLIVEESFKRLDALAEKAGVAVEHFWPIFVQQQVLDWWSSFALAMFFLVFGVLSLIYGLRKMKDPEEFTQYTALWIAGGIATFIGFIVLAFSISDISQVLNPEYHAIESLLGR